MGKYLLYGSKIYKIINTNRYSVDIVLFEVARYNKYFNSFKFESEFMAIRNNKLKDLIYSDDLESLLLLYS